MSEQAENKGNFVNHPENINRAGSPIKPRSWRYILQKIGDEELKLENGDMLTKREAICRILYGKAQEDPRTAALLMDREEGMPEQRQIITGDVQNPLRIIYDDGHKTDAETNDSPQADDSGPGA